MRVELYITPTGRTIRVCDECSHGFFCWDRKSKARSLCPQCDPLALRTKKQAAGHRVFAEIRSGRLVRPNMCSRCFKVGVKIEGHHHDYDQPLQVTWVCKQCHAYLDSIRRNKERAV